MLGQNGTTQIHLNATRKEKKILKCHILDDHFRKVRIISVLIRLQTLCVWKITKGGKIGNRCRKKVQLKYEAVLQKKNTFHELKEKHSGTKCHRGLQKTGRFQGFSLSLARGCCSECQTGCRKRSGHTRCQEGWGGGAEDQRVGCEGGVPHPPPLLSSVAFPEPAEAHFSPATGAWWPTISC